MNAPNHCPVCESVGAEVFSNVKDQRYRIAGCWSYLKCRDCAHAWLFPPPRNREAVANFYPGDYETHAEPISNETSKARETIRIAARRVFGYANDSGPLVRVLSSVISTVGPLREIAGAAVMWLDAQPGGRLLDVGAGAGNFIGRMHGLGWTVLGVEPDPHAAANARRLRGLDVRAADLRDIGFERDSFDAITMHHVIEHIFDPSSLLEEAFKIIKPGGLISVITPNIESQGFRKFKENHWHLECPRHLQIYSNRSLQLQLEAAGFQLIKQATGTRTARAVWEKSSQIVDGRSPLQNHEPDIYNHLKGRLFQLNQTLQKVWNPLVGEELIAVAKKPTSL